MACSILLLLILLSGCSYHWTPNFVGGDRPTLSVPFVDEDADGMLTAQLIAAISTSGIADVKSIGGHYTLQVVILNEETEKIGFRIDQQKVDGSLRKDLFASEARRSITAEVSLLQGGEVVKGPFKISADAEYDYVDGDAIQDLTFVDSQGTLRTVLPFSLGQLEPSESAAKAASTPLYRKLSQKIVDVISPAMMTEFQCAD